ncbi:MAG: hypothetical protein U9Q68_06960 [Euryarchaeota archaeon]|nr:hypothetical protein [Euryarchaeota archaeon]
MEISVISWLAKHIPTYFCNHYLIHRPSFAADVGSDGVISSLDALRILQAVAGLITDGVRRTLSGTPHLPKYHLVTTAVKSTDVPTSIDSASVIHSISRPWHRLK